MGDNSTAVSVSVWRVVFHPEGPGSNACPSVVLARVHTACRVREAWLAPPTLLDENTACCHILLYIDLRPNRAVLEQCSVGTSCEEDWPRHFLLGKSRLRT